MWNLKIHEVEGVLLGYSKGTSQKGKVGKCGGGHKYDQGILYARMKIS
jgi:hypothetical protein